jgi:hypothetical protein
MSHQIQIFESRAFAGTPWLSGPVTCAVCGCRLTLSPDSADESWYHFSPIAGRDARGCVVACAALPHDAHGHAAEASAA